MQESVVPPTLKLRRAGPFDDEVGGGSSAALPPTLPPSTGSNAEGRPGCGQASAGCGQAGGAGIGPVERDSLRSLLARGPVERDSLRSLLARGGRGLARRSRTEGGVIPAGSLP
jgi:hypothetical protein